MKESYLCFYIKVHNAVPLISVGLPQMDDLLSRLSMAKDKITDTEDLISIDLDHRSAFLSYLWTDIPVR